jgi:hypothetical protein
VEDQRLADGDDGGGTAPGAQRTSKSAFQLMGCIGASAACSLCVGVCEGGMRGARERLADESEMDAREESSRATAAPEP